MSQYSSPEAVLVPGPVTLVGPPEAAVDAFLAVVLFFAVSLWASTIVAARTIVPITKRILSIHVLQFSGIPVVVQLCKEANQTRDYCVAKNATPRAARPDPSLRKERLLRMTIKLHHYRNSYANAITSISTNASFGSRATSTVDLAGGAKLKYFPYTSFIAAKSFIFFRKSVARTTFSRLLPAAFRMPARFFIARSVCAATSPAMNCWFAGSIATWPDTKTSPFTRIACEYGPIACGPSFVAITSRIVPRPLENAEPRSQNAGVA